MSRYIDATPTWEAIMPLLIEGVRNHLPDAEVDLMRLARIADTLFAEQEAQADSPESNFE